jgi:hypothetical protein
MWLAKGIAITQNVDFMELTTQNPITMPDDSTHTETPVLPVLLLPTKKSRQCLQHIRQHAMTQSSNGIRIFG